MQQAIERAACFVRQSNVMLIGTGAGMGRDSGLPDFRGNHGFWSNYPPFNKKFNFMQCANPNFLLQHPHLFWGFYGSRLIMYRQKKPHKGYQLLREMADLIALPQQKEANYYAFTSNVDGHLQKADYPDSKILQVHGSIHHLQCFSCQKIQQNKFEPEVDPTEMSCKELPKCSGCGEILRPNVLMFNDYFWLSDRTQQQEVHYVDFLEKNKGEKLVLLEIGCGNQVATIRNMMERHYYRLKKAKFIRINPDPATSIAPQFQSQRYVDVKLGALEALTGIRQLL